MDGRVEQAADTYSAVLAVEPRHAGALRGRGLASMQLKQWAQAAEDLRLARDVSPEEPDTWVELGMSLAMSDQVYPAIDVFEGLLAKWPAFVRGHLELGALYLRIGAIPKARQQFQRALASQPTMEQRRLIESVLRQQDKLDQKRFYRPDFDALHRAHQARPVPWKAWISKLIKPFGRGA